jgi:hypothetical protein
LQAHAYGAGLVYNEMLVTGPGEQEKPSPVRSRPMRIR